MQDRLFHYTIFKMEAFCDKKGRHAILSWHNRFYSYSPYCIGMGRDKQNTEIIIRRNMQELSLDLAVFTL